MARRFDVSVDGESVAAVHHEASGERWLVFCHGFLSDKSGSYESRCERAVCEGYDAVRFDFRGCGESGGAFRDQALSEKIADLGAVVEAVDPDSYALFGSSFGGKVTLHTAAADDRVSAVAAGAPVTDNQAFDDYRGVVERDGECIFKDGRAIDAAFFEDLRTHEFDAVARELETPAALFHGREDESVPIRNSIAAVGRLGTDVLFEAFAGEGHRFSEAAERRLRERLFGWLAAVEA